MTAASRGDEMRCPYCKEHKDRVIDSRSADGGTVVRRRRQCLACSRRYTTYERVESTGKLLVIKKDGSRAPYVREKLLSGLQRACWKLPIGLEALEALVDDVEEEVFRKFEREVPSSHFGLAVAMRLRKLDKVAYLRYASIYHKFQVVDDFIQEARDILDRDQRDVAGQQDLFSDEK